MDKSPNKCRVVSLWPYHCSLEKNVVSTLGQFSLITYLKPSFFNEQCDTEDVVESQKHQSVAGLSLTLRM